MNCKDAKSLMLDALDGRLTPNRYREVLAHTVRCAECREEFEHMQAGSKALKASVDQLAPRMKYLTRIRRERLMAKRPKPKVTKLMTIRRFVAAAAVAAILVSAGFIAHDVVSLARPQPDGAMASQRQAPAMNTPVVLTAAGQNEPLRIMPRPWLEGRASPAPEEHVVRSDSPGVIVPVRHTLYDPEESSLWW